MNTSHFAGWLCTQAQACSAMCTDHKVCVSTFNTTCPQVVLIITTCTCSYTTQLTHLHTTYVIVQLNGQGTNFQGSRGGVTVFNWAVSSGRLMRFRAFQCTRAVSVFLSVGIKLSISDIKEVPYRNNTCYIYIFKSTMIIHAYSL